MALEKILRPGAPNLAAMSVELNIPKETLYGWLRKAQNGSMNKSRVNKNCVNVREKMATVLTARGLHDEELGRWLREKGYHTVQLQSWEQEISAALEGADGHRGREEAQRQKIKELERDLNRKDKALAEMSALIVLKKKLNAILGDVESPT